MPNNKSIHILRGDKSSLSNDLKKTILEPGQPFFDKDAKTLQVGDGSGIIGDNVLGPGSDGSNLATAPYVTVKDGAINDVKVADDAAIKGSKLADANNTSNPSGITTSKIENSAITTIKIADKNVTSAKLADASNTDTPTGITTEKIENGAVTTEKIENRAITSDKLSSITKITIVTGGKSPDYTTWRESSGIAGQVTLYKSKEFNQNPPIKEILKENVLPIIWGDIVVFAKTGVETAEPAEPAESSLKGRSLYLETTASSSLTGDTNYYANKRFTHISEDGIGLNVALDTDSVPGAISLGYPSKSGTLALQSQIPTFSSDENGNLYITTHV